MPDVIDTEKKARNHSILIVDDDENILNSLYRLLRKEGYQLRMAKNVDEAFGFLEKEAFSLIISDQKMPNSTGIEFFQQVKQIHPDTVRILLTGHADLQLTLDAINRGEVYRFILKPWNNDELKWVIYSALMQYELLMENKRLLSLTKEQNVQLKEVNLKLEQEFEKRAQHVQVMNRMMYENFIEVLFYLVALNETRDPSKKGHAEAVRKWSGEIARELGLSMAEEERIRLAGYLHDVGKIAVSERILNKPGVLTAVEKQHVEGHVEAAHQLLRSYLFPAEILKYIIEHHERMDGKGYPWSMPGEKISVGARIIAVADTFDALTSPRPYRQPLDRNAAVKEILNQSNRLFDSQVVQAFLSVLARKEKTG